MGLSFLAPFTMIDRIPAAPKPRMLKATWTRELHKDVMAVHGVTEFDAGIVYCPYIPLLESKVI